MRNLVLLVLLLGALGVGVRFAALKLIGPTSFPIATLIVNSVGSFSIGALYAYQQQQGGASPLLLALSIGFLGALTTFSSFSLDTLRLFQEEQVALGLVNVFANNGLCLLLCFAGLRLVRSGWLFTA